MTEASGAAPSSDRRGQIVVPLAIVGSVTALGLGILVAIDFDKDAMLAGAGLTALVTIVNGLLHALGGAGLGLSKKSAEPS